VLAIIVVGERLAATGWAGLAILFAALIVLAFAPTNVADHRAAALTAAKKEDEVLLPGRVRILTGGGANR
jgi:DME family drug/metabolite transporter